MPVEVTYNGVCEGSSGDEERMSDTGTALRSFPSEDVPKMATTPPPNLVVFLRITRVAKPNRSAACVEMRYERFFFFFIGYAVPGTLAVRSDSVRCSPIACTACIGCYKNE